MVWRALGVVPTRRRARGGLAGTSASSAGGTRCLLSLERETVDEPDTGSRELPRPGHDQAAPLPGELPRCAMLAERSPANPPAGRQRALRPFPLRPQRPAITSTQLTIFAQQ